MPAHVHANTLDQYLSSDLDKELPYVNDAKEPVKFRGTGNFKISWRIPSTIPLHIIRDDSGNMFYSDTDGIYSVDPYGNTLWSYKLPTPHGLKYVNLGVDGTIYAFEAGDEYYQTNGSVFAFNKDGSVKWVYELDKLKTIEFSSSFVGDIYGNFIVETISGIVSINPKGFINWTNTNILKETKVTENLTESNIAQLNADSNGNIFVTTRDNKIYCLDAKGQIKWETEQLDLGQLYFSENVIYSLSNKGLYILDDSTGKESNMPPKEIPLTIALPTDHMGGFYVPTNYGIEKIDKDGNKLWKYEIRDIGYRDAYNLTSDTDGNIYFTNNGGSVYSLDKDGRERFVLYIQNHVSDGSEIITDSTGTAYILSYIGLLAITPNIEPVKVLKDKKELFFPIHPVVLEGTTLLPMRKIFESLGATINWNSETNSVVANKDNTTISITLGSKIAQINGVDIKLDVIPINKNGTTMVPLRFISETFGEKVKWNSDKNLIELLSPNGNVDTNSSIVESKNILSDASGRFYLVTGGKWEPTTAKSNYFLAADDQDHYLEVDSLNKIDLKDNVNLSDIVEYTHNNINNILNNPAYSNSVNLTIHENKAIQYDVKGEYNKLKLHYLVTIIESSDRFHILFEWSQESKFLDFLQPFEEMVKNFRVMDSQNNTVDA